mmetsp:Transcript_30899/g.86273  ORF Transcript_30899/g.86273 Transcript_30899/m.86273 type:complete len:217 (-) Transcript_30899:78-728(-)
MLPHAAVAPPAARLGMAMRAWCQGGAPATALLGPAAPPLPLGWMPSGMGGRAPAAHAPSQALRLPFELPTGRPDACLIPELPGTAMDLPPAAVQERLAPEPEGVAAVELPPGAASAVGDLPGAPAPMECIRYGLKKGRYKAATNLKEKWWLEYDPPKSFFISGYGRGPQGGHSIQKKDWPCQMPPIRYKQKWEKREQLRYAFRKNGFEYDIPKWGG